MARKILLIRYPSRPFKDHWAIFIPSVTDENFGTLIQVEGDLRNGFTFSIRRNYNLSLSRRKYIVYQIGTVEDKYVHETPSSGALKEATDLKDDIERVARSVAAPGPSLRSVEGNAVGSVLSYFNFGFQLTSAVASNPASGNPRLSMVGISGNSCTGSKRNFGPRKSFNIGFHPQKLILEVSLAMLQIGATDRKLAFDIEFSSCDFGVGNKALSGC